MIRLCRTNNRNSSDLTMGVLNFIGEISILQKTLLLNEFNERPLKIFSESHRRNFYDKPFFFTTACVVILVLGAKLSACISADVCLLYWFICGHPLFEKNSQTSDLASIRTRNRSPVKKVIFLFVSIEFIDYTEL